MSADLDLARRAVACPGWRWMPGMAWRRDFAGGQSLGDRTGRILTEWDAVDSGGRVFRLTDDMLPDLDDRATLGCLLALVRNRHGEDASADYARHSADLRRPWRVSTVAEAISIGRTEAEALVAALEVSDVR